MRPIACAFLLSSAAAAGESSIADRPAITIYRDASRYDSFPDVARLPDGRILCVFRDAKYPRRVTHIDPDARIVGCISVDDGRTWSAPQVIYDDPACQQ